MRIPDLDRLCGPEPDDGLAGLTPTQIDARLPPAGAAGARRRA